MPLEMKGQSLVAGLKWCCLHTHSTVGHEGTPVLRVLGGTQLLNGVSRGAHQVRGV